MFATTENYRSLGPVSYQDREFVPPSTARKTAGMIFDEVEIWGGFAAVEVLVTYHSDAGCLIIEDIELVYFDFSDASDFYVVWESAQINRWRNQSRINEIIAEVIDRVADKL